MGSEKAKDDPLLLSEVFNPGQFPRHTYRPRQGAETAINKWWDDRGTILIVNGPSKTGKTVLVRKLIDQHSPIWIEGHGLDSTEVLWSRIADKLNLYTTISRESNEQDEHASTFKADLGVLAISPTSTTATGQGSTWTVNRPIEEVAREALLKSDRPLIIDDIHFVPGDVQEQIIKALKPLVFGSQESAGCRVVFISIGNRVINVLTTLPDMRDRMTPLPIEYWTHEDLKKIAEEGFAKLHLTDSSGELAARLATQSFGSPQLMQQLCRELCYGAPNGLRQAASAPTEIYPPDEWRAFFEAQLLDDVGEWVMKLAKGPEQRGNERKLFKLKSGGERDAYQVLLLAVASTGPKLALTKDEIRVAFGEVLTKPPTSIPSWVLSNMSLIAATKLQDKLPPLTTLRENKKSGFDPYAQADLQPVLEYRDTGATSALVITDPYFAFYLAWGLNQVLDIIDTPSTLCLGPSEEDVDADLATELEEWGDPS